MADTSPIGSSLTNDQASMFAENLVLTRVFEQALKGTEDDDSSFDEMGAADEVNRAMALGMAQSITGFGE